MANQRSDELSDQQLEGISGGTGSPIPKGATGTVGNSGISSSTAGSDSTINSGLNPNPSDISGNSSGSMGDLQSSLHQAGIDTSPPESSEVATSGTSGSHSDGTVYNLPPSEISAELLANEQQQALLEKAQQQQLAQQVEQAMAMKKEMDAMLQMENQLRRQPGGQIAAELLLEDDLAILAKQKLGPL